MASMVVGGGGVAGRAARLWAAAAGQVVRLARPRWWRRWPPVPAPDPHYLRFRLQTQYGDPDREPEPADVLAYLRWSGTTAGLQAEPEIPLAPVTLARRERATSSGRRD